MVRGFHRYDPEAKRAQFAAAGLDLKGLPGARDRPGLGRGARRSGQPLDRGGASGADRDGRPGVMRVMGVRARGRSGIASRRLACAGVVLAALVLAACTAVPPVVAPQAAVPTPPKPAEADMTPAVLREHQRILAAYGGIYNDPRLQSDDRADRSSVWWRHRSGPISITRSRCSIPSRSMPSRCRPASFT